MPSIKFQNLKNKKKNNILESIGNVLSKSNVDDVSIVEIADEAEISRGTFYNYFEDKNDAINTYTEYYLMKFIDFFKNEFSKNKNDFIKTIKVSYDQMADVFKNDLYIKIVNNLKSTSGISRMMNFEREVNSKVEELVQYIYENIDKHKLPIKNISEVEILVQLTGNAIMSSFAKIAAGQNRDNQKKQFELKINIIEKGIISYANK